MLCRLMIARKPSATVSCGRVQLEAMLVKERAGSCFLPVLMVPEAAEGIGIKTMKCS